MKKIGVLLLPFLFLIASPALVPYYKTLQGLKFEIPVNLTTVSFQLEELNLTKTNQYYLIISQLKQMESPKLKEIKELKKELEKNEFILSYKNYLSYKELEQKVAKLKRLVKKGEKYRNEYKKMITRLNSLTPQRDLFRALIKLKPLRKPPTITNPFQIFQLLGYKKQVQEILEQNRKNYLLFSQTHQKLLYLWNLEQECNLTDRQLKQTIKDFELVSEIYQTKLEEVEKQGEAYLQQVEREIEYQINKLINLGIVIGIILFLFFTIKILIRRYLKDERAYLINKVLNFLNANIILIILVANYIENTTYLITLLGFASAGIAIAMKDWFMNMFGWVVIMLSGNFKVGDRIKISLQNGNIEIVGDIIDITLNRIVIYEDVTFTTYQKNRRAGRVIFVPNNVIFNNPIFNYSHHGLETVWDGIDLVLTFDSNIEKAEKIARKVVEDYTYQFIERTRSSMKRLIAEYNIKARNLEPRIFTFFETYGIKLSIWYLAPFAPMGIRSKISKKLLEEFNRERDITIAYPTYKLEESFSKKALKEGHFYISDNSKPV